MADARLAGLVPALDAFVLDRALRVARRLKARERELTLMVELQAETLSAPTFATDIAKRLDANADLATHIVLGFSQDALFGFGDVEAEILASFGERSFRFALTGVRDVDLEAGALHTLGVRYLRVAGNLLTDPDAAKNSDLHPADLPGLMRRHGILLIAEDADTEGQVADLLDLDVRAAQGAVFGVPRPVRPEIFGGEEPKPQAPAVKAGERPVPHKPFRSIARRA
jgi:cyclic-di-GMP phosphodiesterase TipF (flagellum assembly factor)